MLAAAVFTVLFSYLALRGIDLHKAWHGLRTSDYWWLLPALAAFGLGNLARALRWRALFARGRRPAAGTTLNAMMVGYLYNNIFPARAGEVARVLVLKQRSSAPAAEISATVALERVYDVGGLLLVLLLAKPWLPRTSWFATATTVAIALAVVVAVCALALSRFGDGPLRLALRPLQKLAPSSRERLEHMAGALTHGLSGLRHPRVASEALLWTLTAWMMSALCAYLIMLAFHLQLPFAAGVLVVVAIGLSMILPAAPAAIGIFEGATLIALKGYGLSRSTALPYALVLHLVNFLPFLAVGAVLLYYNSRHPRDAHAQRRGDTEARALESDREADGEAAGREAATAVAPALAGRGPAVTGWAKNE